MRIWSSIIIGCISYIAIAQDIDTSQSFQSETLTTFSSELLKRNHLHLPPARTSLSHTRPIIIPSQYHLMVIDLSVDIRKQYKEKSQPPLLHVAENKFIQSTYEVALPSVNTSSNSSFRITGSRGLNTNGINTTNGKQGRIKNTAYKDAGQLTGDFFPYYWNRIPSSNQ